MTARSTDLLSYERPLIARGEVVVGIDEVGRGALAGPLTVAAVVLSRVGNPPGGLDDSKALTARQRQLLVAPIQAWCSDYCLGSVSACEIDEWGLRLALAVAATRALDGLRVTPTHALIDGPLNLLDAPNALSFARQSAPSLPYASINQTRIVGGDHVSAVIAAASIVAKVHRDSEMSTLALDHPQYGWEANKGYGVPRHLKALREHGPCGHHRQSWSLPERKIRAG